MASPGRVVPWRDARGPGPHSINLLARVEINKVFGKPGVPRERRTLARARGREAGCLDVVSGVVRSEKQMWWNKWQRLNWN